LLYNSTSSVFCNCANGGFQPLSANDYSVSFGGKLLSWWPLTFDFSDLGPAGNNAVANNSGSFRTVNGPYTGMYGLNLTTHTFATFNYVKGTQTVITISYWVKVAQAPAGTTYPVFTLADSTLRNGIWTYITAPSSSTMRAVCVSASGGTSSGVGLTFTVGAWTHITVVSGNGNNYFYINGGYITGFTHAMTLVNTTGLIGTDWTNSNYFVGQLSDIRMYSKALNATEVSILYNSTAAVYCN